MSSDECIMSNNINDNNDNNNNYDYYIIIMMIITIIIIHIYIYTYIYIYAQSDMLPCYRQSLMVKEIETMKFFKPWLPRGPDAADLPSDAREGLYKRLDVPVRAAVPVRVKHPQAKGL